MKFSRMVVAAALVPVLALSLTGCASTGSTSASGNGTVAIAGSDLASAYALYFDVVKDQKRIDQVFITKSGAPDIRGVTRDISAFAKGELEVLKSYEVAGIRLDRTGLPPAEVAARQNIEGVKTNQLLGSSGGKFRARLIATEVEAVTYATSLAKVIADAETNAERKAHMTQSAAKWESFAGRLDGLMR